MGWVVSLRCPASKNSSSVAVKVRTLSREAFMLPETSNPGASFRRGIVGVCAGICPDTRVARRLLLRAGRIRKLVQLRRDAHLAEQVIGAIDRVHHPQHEPHVAVDRAIRRAVERGVRTNKTAFRGIEVRELIRTEDKTLTPGAKFYFVSRYFHSKEHVYIVTGLSRNGETPHMIRFFESLKFTPDSRAALAGVRRLSELKVSPVDIKYADVPPATDKSPTSAKPARLSCIRNNGHLRRKGRGACGRPGLFCGRLH